MPALLRRAWPFLGAAALGVAAAAVYFHARRDPPRPPRDMAELLERVRPLGLYAVPASSGGVDESVYLSTAPHERGDFIPLPHDTARAGEWSGVVFVAKWRPTIVDEGERVGPFLLFGDPKLVRKLCAALAK